MRLFAVLCVAATGMACAVLDNAVDRTETEVQGMRLFLAGEITSRTPAHFERVIADNPQLSTIVLTVMSGALDEAAVHQMGYLIRARGLDTHLTAESEIYSGAVSLFVAGHQRSMAPGAVIGVHAWADGFGPATAYPKDAVEHAANVSYTQAMLGDDAFYWFSLQAAPPDRIHEMTGAEIARFGLLTQP